MSDSRFDVSKLAVGDEVGVERDRDVSVAVVVAIHGQDVIELDSYDMFGWDGRHIFGPGDCRLVPPTDEGRANALREAIGMDLACLRDMTRPMGLPELRRLRADLVGLIAGRRY